MLKWLSLSLQENAHFSAVSSLACFSFSHACSATQTCFSSDTTLTSITDSLLPHVHCDWPDRQILFPSSGSGRRPRGLRASNLGLLFASPPPDSGHCKALSSDCPSRRDLSSPGAIQRFEPRGPSARHDEQSVPFVAGRHAPGQRPATSVIRRSHLRSSKSSISLAVRCDCYQRGWIWN